MTDQDQPHSGSRWEPTDRPTDQPSAGPIHGPTGQLYAGPPLTVPAPPSRWERFRGASRRPGVLVGAGVLGLALVAGGGGFALGQSGGHDTPVSGYAGFDGDGDGLRPPPPGLPPAGQVAVPGQGDDEHADDFDEADGPDHDADHDDGGDRT